ncbi:MAG: NADH-quinone oxidoreductase subunit M [Verrucomicrobia bacterium 13_1_20CM_4_54_11]|jgi:NADH-quinone oxidoreductase subunit M|nr:MAG: NADH-quinone oxidoreductase subunit M [Verrucomicrobia bacterium 13_1_20CM_4_54_11]
MIAWTIYITFAGAVLVLLFPRAFSRWIALLTTTATFAISLATFLCHDLDLAHFTTIVRVPWVPALGMNYYLAVDGISLTLVLVTSITAVSSVLFSWDIDQRVNEFFFWLLLVVGGSFGVFLSADLFLLFVFYELVIVPKYFLIAIWGSTNKEYGAMKLTLYSFFGGALVFIGIIAAYVSAGSLDLNELARFQFTPQLQSWAFPILFLGFAVLAGIWPLHTWAPTGHVAAPTAGSMLLAGIVMKLGAYGGLRVAMNLFPQGFQMWSTWIAILAVIGIVYAAAVALRQRDLKFVIGYSSVSHMGFVLLGLATANVLGVSGAVLQMFSHGVIGALLFAVAGRMIYRRTHTRDLDQLSLMDLNRALPFAAFVFVIASAASMGIPGFSGFAAEITILIGVWKAFPVAVWITGAGMVLVAAFTLRALKKSFFEGGPAALSGDVKEFAASSPLMTSPAERPIHLEPVTIPEKLGAGLLMFTTVAIGIYPKFLLDRIQPAVEAMRFLAR